MSIPTIYNGIEYRSRLEARWAAFFDLAGWRHTYEPFDGDGYIPDFVLHGEVPCLVEIKPAITSAEYHAPIPKIEKANLQAHRILILGVTPLPDLPNSSYEQSFGLLGEACFEYVDARISDEQVCRDGYDWNPALLHTTDCGLLGFCHEYQSYAHSPCGCYDGNSQGYLNRSLVQKIWAEATNAVKWRGRAA